MDSPDFGQVFEVELDLDKKRIVRIDFNTFCKAERETGLNYLNVNEELTGDRLRGLLWAGLQYEKDEEPLSLDVVGRLIGAYYVEVMLGMSMAMLKAMPDPKKLEDSENPLETAPAQS